MINQAAKKILKALSFDGVEVEMFRHMADLKRLDPMKIFYKKVDEKIYNGSHAVPVRIFFPNEKSFRESEEKKADSQERKLLLFIHGALLELEPVAGDVLRTQRKRLGERVRPVAAGLAGKTVDEVEADVVKPGSAGVFNGHLHLPVAVAIL